MSDSDEREIQEALPQNAQPAGRGAHFAQPSRAGWAAGRGRRSAASGGSHFAQAGAGAGSGGAAGGGSAALAAAPGATRGRRLPGVVRFAAKLLLAAGVAAALAFVLTTYLVQLCTVPTESMSPTVAAGDYAIAQRVSYYLGAPQQGDVVTFTAYAEVTGTGASRRISDSGSISLVEAAGLEEVVLVKRVIATGGQTIMIRDGAVYVDGVELAEEYLPAGTSTTVGAGAWEGWTVAEETAEDGSTVTVYSYTLADDELWLMGDNRSNSYDSRSFGPVPTGAVIACVFFCFSTVG